MPRQNWYQRKHVGSCQRIQKVDSNGKSNFTGRVMRSHVGVPSRTETVTRTASTRKIRIVAPKMLTVTKAGVSAKNKKKFR